MKLLAGCFTSNEEKRDEFYDIEYCFITKPEIGKTLFIIYYDTTEKKVKKYETDVVKTILIKKDSVNIQTENYKYIFPKYFHDTTQELREILSLYTKLTSEEIEQKIESIIDSPKDILETIYEYNKELQYKE